MRVLVLQGMFCRIQVKYCNILIQYFPAIFAMVKKEGRKEMNEVAVDTTVNIHKLVHRISFKKKAPRALSGIRLLVAKMMKTEDVRIDPKLNQYLWSQGIRNLPRRVRVRISRKRNEDEAKGQQWYSLVQHVSVETFASRLTEKVKVAA